MSEYIETKIEGFKLRFATKDDVGTVLGFIKELAKYENLEDEVIATESILYNSLFVKRAAEVIIAEYNDKSVGFALFFHNFSTFLGKPGLYLEDLFISEEMRGKGFGKAILTFLAKLAIDRDCGRFEWSCLEWNEPSIQFYRNLGAISMDGWMIFRVHNEALNRLAEEF